MKIKFPAFLFVILMVGVTVPSVQAEHSELQLDLSQEQEKRVQEYLNLSDMFAGLNDVIYNGKSDQEIIKMVRDSVTKDFKDPDSAKFRNERVFRTRVEPRHRETGEVIEDDGIYVCGEVNGKNSYGAYAGYRDYWGGHFLVEMESEDDDLFTYLSLHYCFRK